MLFSLIYLFILSCFSPPQTPSLIESRQAGSNTVWSLCVSNSGLIFLLFNVTKSQCNILPYIPFTLPGLSPLLCNDLLLFSSSLIYFFIFFFFTDFTLSFLFLTDPSLLFTDFFFIFLFTLPPSPQPLTSHTASSSFISLRIYHSIFLIASPFISFILPSFFLPPKYLPSLVFFITHKNDD